MCLVQDRQERRPPNDKSLRQLRPPKDQESNLPSPEVYAAIPRKTSEEAARVVAHLTLISGSFRYIPKLLLNKTREVFVCLFTDFSPTLMLIINLPFDFELLIFTGCRGKSHEV